MGTCAACGKPKPRQAVRFCSPACYHSNRATRPAAERFWEKVEKTDGCWEWRGFRDHNGAGRFAPQGNRPLTAYRYSWELANGPIPAGMLICHHCDNRGCVRPDHLFVGTQTDNMRDAAAKGRLFPLGDWMRANPHLRRWLPRPGEANPAAKLTRDQIVEIRSLWPGSSQPALARRFGVSQSTVWSIVHNKTWVA